MLRLLPTLLLAAVVACPAVAAETKYVTDQNDFHLRAGASTRYKIVRTLASGTTLTVLSVDEKTGYAQVKTADDTTGYILARYLQDEPPAREQVAALKARLAELQQAPDQLASRLSTLQAEHTKLADEHAALTREKEQLEQEVAEIRHASANVVRIDRERKQLQDQVASLLVEVDALKQSNLELANRERQQWFLIGGGVVTGGILIGLILPNLRLRRRRSSWGSL